MRYGEIIVGQEYRRVVAVVDWPAGQHPLSPIRDDLPARQWVTSFGSRWSGVRPDGTPYCDPTGAQTNPEKAEG